MNITAKISPIGEEREKELFKDSQIYSYKKTAQASLRAIVFSPQDHSCDDKSSVMIFFHGGFWENQALSQFAPQCLHFAEKKIVCVVAETRVSSIHQATPLDAVEDVFSLIIFIKQQAKTLGIEPSKVVLVGAAGGAWLALQAAMRKEVPSNDGVDARPAALILLSALVDTTAGTDYVNRFPDNKMAKLFSPSKMIRKKLPPMLFLHGKIDKVISVEAVRSFRRWMKWRGNHVELIEFEAVDHRFFNLNTSHVHYDLCLRAMECFLVAQQLIDESEFSLAIYHS
jgi:acetyl esterase